MKSRYLIIWSKQGQLANRILFFAHIMAFAQKYGFKIINLTFYDYSGYFKEMADDFLCRYPKPVKPLKLPIFLRKILYRLIFFLGKKLKNCNNKTLSSFHYTNENEIKLLTDPTCLESLSKSKYVLLNGWMLRDYNSLLENKDDIRTFFVPKDHIYDKVLNFTSNLKQKNHTLVGIHIRRGDYKDFEGGRYYYELEEYKHVMFRMIDLLKKEVIFLICTNENIELNQFQEFNCALGLGSSIEDLYSLSECDYIIGPPSTFSIWASFYGDKLLYQLHDTNCSFSLDDFSLSVG